MADQVQRGGAHSTNVQIINAGPSLAETRAYVLDIVRAEVGGFHREAERLIEDRLGAMADRVLEMVQAKGDGAASAFADPDVQFVTAAVGREYARSGDEDLGAVLVGLLGDRISEPPRTLIALVLNDAIQTTARLTEAEIAALSLTWRLTRTIWNGMTSLAALEEFVIRDLLPFKLPKWNASYYHLESLGCGSLGVIVGSRFGDVLLATYSGVFVRGFEKETIPEEIRYLAEDDRVFMPALRDPSRLQIRAINDTNIDEISEQVGAPEHAEALKSLASLTRFSAEEVEQAVIEIEPALAETIELWNSTEAKDFRISAVGIAIAHANFRRVSGMETPLSTWIE